MWLFLSVRRKSQRRRDLVSLVSFWLLTRTLLCWARTTQCSTCSRKLSLTSAITCGNLSKDLNGNSTNDRNLFPKELEVKPAVEIGGSQHRLHAHIIISLEHRSRIHLNLELLRSAMSKRLGYRPHINIAIIKRPPKNQDFSSIAKDYIRKNPL